MHIEPGIIAPAKLVFAAVTASALYLGYLPRLLKNPALLLRTALAAVFFSLFMQAFHMQVGPSELHFIGAMPIYLTFGFIPTLFGFAIGLLLQGALFEPQDLVHLAVNSLSLAVPLIALHYSFGKKLTTVNVSTILKLDAFYYSGVTLMVGFWLLMANRATPFLEWAHFASSYSVLVVLEPVITIAILMLIQRFSHIAMVARCFANSSVNVKTVQRA
jgi:ABC-type Co2+ transport system permease subunit